MKIKSHTGEMVEARVGMKYSHEYGNYELFTIKNFEDNFIIAEVKYADVWRHDPKYCTMLHCPFQVGDEVEALGQQFGYPDEWLEYGKLELSDIEDIKNGTNSEFRHTNPALRDAPDYRRES